MVEEEEVADWMGIWYGEVMVYIDNKPLSQARKIFLEESDHLSCGVSAYLVKVVEIHSY